MVVLTQVETYRHRGEAFKDYSPLEFELWNSVDASFINRQRYRYLDNILKKQWRSSRNEQASSEWRSKNADFWNALIPRPPVTNVSDDYEPPHDDAFEPGELLQLA
ncbi:unnamed protein product [Phytophthora lilii]|uniref:Unnamed protein product n=1 Tax=Phytophthora lilii TaxID=2077276 RepID=A0A9W6XDF0_9STRA|nr:unnamed protein product [Phytophthora lilii]